MHLHSPFLHSTEYAAAVHYRTDQNACTELLLSLDPCSVCLATDHIESPPIGLQAGGIQSLQRHPPFSAGGPSGPGATLCRHLADPRLSSLQLAGEQGAVSSHRFWPPLVYSETCFRNSPALTGQGPLSFWQALPLGACAVWTRACSWQPHSQAASSAAFLPPRPSAPVIDNAPPDLCPTERGVVFLLRGGYWLLHHLP